MTHPVDALKDFMPMTNEQEAQLRKFCDTEVCSCCGKPILKWTSEAPTVPGWYWMNEDDEKSIVAIRMEPGLVLYDSCSEIDRSLPVDTEWYGPIEPPDEAGCPVAAKHDLAKG